MIGIGGIGIGEDRNGACVCVCGRDRTLIHDFESYTMSMSSTCYFKA